MQLHRPQLFRLSLFLLVVSGFNPMYGMFNLNNIAQVTITPATHFFAYAQENLWGDLKTQTYNVISHTPHYIWPAVVGAGLVYVNWTSVVKLYRKIKGKKGSFFDPLVYTKLKEPVNFAGALPKAVVTLLNQIKKPEHYENTGANTLFGVLFAGPTGLGKTNLVKYIAQECNAVIHNSTPEMRTVGKIKEGDHTGLTSAIYASCMIKYGPKRATKQEPVIFVLEEFAEQRSTPYARNYEDKNETDQHDSFVDTLLTGLDGIDQRPANVLWLATTNRVSQIDPALRRRFKLVTMRHPGRRSRYLQAFDILGSSIFKSLSLEKRQDLALLFVDPICAGITPDEIKKGVIGEVVNDLMLDNTHRQQINYESTSSQEAVYNEEVIGQAIKQQIAKVSAIKGRFKEQVDSDCEDDYIWPKDDTGILEKIKENSVKPWAVTQFVNESVFNKVTPEEEDELNNDLSSPKRPKKQKRFVRKFRKGRRWRSGSDGEDNYESFNKAQKEVISALVKQNQQLKIAVGKIATLNEEVIKKNNELQGLLNSSGLVRGVLTHLNIVSQPKLSKNDDQSPKGKEKEEN